MDIEKIIADGLDQNLGHLGMLEEAFDIDQLDQFINDISSTQKLDDVLDNFANDYAVPPPPFNSDQGTSSLAPNFIVFADNKSNQLQTTGVFAAAQGSCNNGTVDASSAVIVSRCRDVTDGGRPPLSRQNDMISASPLLYQDVSAAKIALLASAFLQFQNRAVSPPPDQTSSLPDVHWVQTLVASGFGAGPSGQLDSSPVSIDTESGYQEMSPLSWSSGEQQAIGCSDTRLLPSDVSIKTAILDSTHDEAGTILSAGENRFFANTPPESASSATSPYLLDHSTVSECDLSLSDRTFSSQLDSEIKRPAKVRCRDVGRDVIQSQVHRVMELGNSFSTEAFEPIKKKKRKLSARSINRGKVNEVNDQDIKVQFEQVEGPENSDDESLDRLVDVSLLEVHTMSWTDHQPESWSKMFDEHGLEIKNIDFHVDCDKGFNFQFYDLSFVCQKKNHFQVTAEAGYVSSTPAMFVCSPNGSPLPITGFYLHFHGIKMEIPSYRVQIEQSEADRSKHPMDPIRIDMRPNKTVKAVAPRMHFSETTANNMRKRGKPNPDQRYFRLVVSLCVHHNDTGFVIAAKVSDKIIVRASNPGQFENDAELMWIKGKSPESVFHVGNVGINTDCPDEALTVHGNIHLTGRIVLPSDVRVKHNIQELDTTTQLNNILKLKLYSYDFDDKFSEQVNIPQHSRSDAGVLAQDLREVLPDAVVPSGNVTLSNGDVIEDFLLVNKDRLFFENIGAVKELCKVACKLENRIDEMEIMNKKLSKLSRTTSGQSTGSTSSTSAACRKHRLVNCQKCSSSSRRSGPNGTVSKISQLVCTSRAFRVITITLVIVMTLCVAGVTALYVMTKQSSSNSTNQMNTTHAPVNVNGFTNSSSPNNPGGGNIASIDIVSIAPRSNASNGVNCGTNACNTTPSSSSSTSSSSLSTPTTTTMITSTTTTSQLADLSSSTLTSSSPTFRQYSISTVSTQSELGNSSLLTLKVRRRRASELNQRRHPLRRLQ